MNLQGLLVTVIVSIVTFPLGLPASEDARHRYLRDPFTWNTVQAEVEGEIEGGFWGIAQGALIVAGGEVRSPSGKMILSDAIRVRPLEGNGSFLRLDNVALERPTAHGASVGTADGFICVGGVTNEGVSKRNFRIHYDPDSGAVLREDMPPLPVARAYAGAIVHDSVLYVTGGGDAPDGAMASNSLWRLNLGGEESASGEWKELPSWPGVGRLSPLLSAQFDGLGDSLILLGGTKPDGNPSREVFGFDLKDEKWRRLSDLPEPGRIQSAVEVGVAHVFALPAGEPGSPLSFLAYHTITNTWVESAPLPFGGLPLVTLWDRNSLVVVTEGSGGQLEVSTGSAPKVGKAMHRIDYLIILGYIAVLIFLGYYFSRREKTTDDFFRGGKRISGWVAGISILGTRWSAISFMSIPAKAFATNWIYYINQFGHMIAAIVVVRYFVAFFCKLNVTTAYEYLGRRFGLVVQSIGSIKFVLFDIFRMGVLILLPSMVLSVITGVHIYYCILVIGVVSTLYTYLGGIEAVIWSDVMQLCIMISGVLIAIGIALYRVEDPMAAFSFAAKNGKTEVFDWGFNFSTLTVWVFLLSLPGSANEEVSAQYIVQRFVSAKNQKHAATSAWINGFVGPILIFSFFFMGTAMWIFYQAHPEELNPLMRQPDEILAWFVVEQLPVGLSGLMIGAIFAATMSSLDSSLSSTTTVIINDGYRRFKGNVTEVSALRAAQQITLILGVVGTGSALILAALQVRSLLDYMLELLALLGGGLAGIFYLGMFTTRTGSRGVIMGFIASVSVLYVFKFHTDFSFFLYGAVGVASCVLIGYAASFFLPDEERDLRGLTVHTLEK